MSRIILVVAGIMFVIFIGLLFLVRPESILFTPVWIACLFFGFVAGTCKAIRDEDKLVKAEDRLVRIERKLEEK